MVFRTWDLNFGAWIFTLEVSKTETWKLLERDFQDVGSQFWDLVFIGNFSTNFRHKFLFYFLKKGCFAPLCVPLGLKKPGDFTVSKGIRLQIFRFFGGWVWNEGKKGTHERIVSDRHGNPLVTLMHKKLVWTHF
jgi:hypothetical protein